MSLETNKAIIRRYNEMWQTGEVQIADEIMSPGYIDHSHPEWPAGVEGVKASVRAFHQAFSEIEGQTEQMISEGEWVAFRFTLQARHTGAMGPFPATGKHVVYRGTDFIRLEGGKMVELWSAADTLDWVKQL